MSATTTRPGRTQRAISRTTACGASKWWTANRVSACRTSRRGTAAPRRRHAGRRRCARRRPPLPHVRPRASRASRQARSRCARRAPAAGIHIPRPHGRQTPRAAERPLHPSRRPVAAAPTSRVSSAPDSRVLRIASLACCVHDVGHGPARAGPHTGRSIAGVSSSACSCGGPIGCAWNRSVRGPSRTSRDRPREGFASHRPGPRRRRRRRRRRRSQRTRPPAPLPQLLARVDPRRDVEADGCDGHACPRPAHARPGA